MSVHREIFQALKDYLVANLTEANWVTLGYVDERADSSDETSYPILTITLYDKSISSEQRPGGMRFVTDNEDETSSIFKPPIPVDFHFQLDALADKHNDYWDLCEALTIILGRQWSNFTTSGGQKLYMMPEDIVPLTGLEGSIHRTSFRFYVQAWLTDPTTPIVVQQVVKLNIQNKDQELSGGTVEVI